MLIGSWGPLIFEVSGISALTFSEISQNSSGRWVNHEPINTAPISEFLGPGQDKVEIIITFSSMLGVDPSVSFELLRQLIRKGTYFPLILMGSPLSANMWYAESINGTSKTFEAGTGRILTMEVTCPFKEYH